MEKAEWLSQVRRGILEYCILLLISHKSMYGYDLITSLNKWETLSITEGTIYPLLRRLEKEGSISSTWKETSPGVPPRKYYDLTGAGHKTLKMMNVEWGNLTTSIVQIKNNKETEND